MHFIDISLPISASTPKYPGDPSVEIRDYCSLARGGITNTSLLTLSAHTGTHIDAPAHFFEDGAPISAITLEAVIGEAHVIELETGANLITAEHVACLVPQNTTRVLFKTKNSTWWSDPLSLVRDEAHAYISAGAASLLVKRGVQLVGIDYLSVDPLESPDFPAHKVLLGAGVWILEGLDLREAAAGAYELVCLPLRLTGGLGDAAPARALLRMI